MVDGYRTEEEQARVVKAWWGENGKSIVVGIAIGLVALFGWRGWQNHTTLQAGSASTLYQQMILASRNDDPENMRIYADRILGDYESTRYAIFATLMLARLAVEENDPSTAETHLHWVLKNNSQAGIVHIARLRLASVLIAADKLDVAMNTLNSNEPGQFISRYEELKGDIFIKQDKLQDAKNAYERALAHSSSPADADAVLKMKLDDLGRI